MLSPEEYILDFKAEEKRTHSTVFDIEDIESECSTISASEVNDCNTPTPPLLCKLRKARVMIKKLPRHVLEKYNLNSNETCISSSIKPSRSSKRIGAKTVPGLYLSLHVNKPLNEVLNKKKRIRRQFLNSTGPVTLKQKHVTQDTKTLGFSQKSFGSSRTSVFQYRKMKNITVKPSKVINSSSSGNTSSRRRNIQERIAATRKIDKDRQFIKPNVPTNHPIFSTKSRSSFNRERISATRKINNNCLINKPVASILPNFPDVVITKYEMPTNNLSRTPENTPIVSSNPITSYNYNQSVNNDSHLVSQFQNIYNNYQNSAMLSTRPQHNITIQVPMTYAPTIPNFPQTQSTQSTNAFPTVIMSAPRHLPMIANSAATVSTENLLSLSHQSTDLLQHQPKIASQKTAAVQTSTVPPEKTTGNDSIIMNSPNVLVITHPSRKSDPLNMPSTPAKDKNLPKRHRKENESFADSDTETCDESDSDLELSDTVKRAEPEVIKRIIYHTKSVQTKFTCNGTICGLVDSDDFNLNCFYCYEIFPLHKWRDFKEHIKFVHQVEEKDNELNSNVITKNVQSQKCATSNANKVYKQNKPTNLSTKQLIKSDTLTNIDNSMIKRQCVNEQFYKKLPLEPRLVAQRLNKMATEHVKELPCPQKSPDKPTKQLNQSQNSNETSRTDLSSDNFDDIISLESDDCDDNIEHVDDVIENFEKRPQKLDTPNSRSLLKNSSSLIDEVAKLIPPHITIKKVQNNLSKATPNTPKPAPEISESLKEPFIKVPSNLNIQRVIKYIPKPTTQQLATNGGGTRPRYFVVKKIVKPASTQKKPNINISKGTIITKMSESDKSKIGDDDMPSNDENEDAVPKPTNGRGILFGVTNPMVVIEFLLKLKTFPELWRPQLKTNFSNNFDESIKKLCFHLNNRFDLNIQDFEMRLSIQRVKDWYCRILKKIYEHNQNLNNTEPYKHKFPLYFKVLNQFLTSDVHFTNNLLLKSRFKSDTNMNKYPKWMVNKTGIAAPKPNVFNLDKKVIQKKEEVIENKSPITDLKAPQTTTPSSTPLLDSPSAIDVAPSDINMDNLIEFDADTLYEDESSDEEILEQFDETKISNEEINKIDTLKKFRTKVYLGNYECDVCKKSYKRRCDLKRHRIHHFPPEFECAVCSQKFYFKHWAKKCNHLQRQKYLRKTYNHVPQENNGFEKVMPKRIWPKKIFKFKLICEICGASYKQIGSLNCHKRDKHLNQRLKCVVCNFTALTNYRIVQHQKKRHIVEPGTVEEVAKRSRARMDTKTPFSVEARQEFDWRREMRKKLKPGEKFYACCKCRIIFNSRKEKVLHNKIEHPIKETTVLCLLCLPTKFLLSNSNSARRHYTDIHKVPWDEIDALVKRTKPVFNILSKEEIELLNASENYKELLEELIKDRELEPVEKIKTQEDGEEEEAVKAVQNLQNATELDVDVNKVDVECTQEENVFVDGIIDHDYNNGEVYNDHEYANNNEHDYSEEQTNVENNDVYEEDNDQSNGQIYSHGRDVDGVEHLDYNIECAENVIHHQAEDEQEYLQSIVDDFVDGELVDGQLVEECIVVEECIDDIIDEEEEYF